MKDTYDPASEQDDEKKLKRLEQEFDLVVRERLGLLHSMAERWVGHDQAEDVVQEALLKCWQTLPHYSAERLMQLNLGGYIYRVVVNISRTNRGPRDVIVVPLDDESYALTADEGLEPEKVIDHRQNIDALIRAINHLPQNYQEIIWRHYFAELTLEEIALQLKRPLNTIKSWHRRAKRLLVKLYRQEC